MLKDENYLVILHVENGEHFVLGYDWDENGILVNDPYYDKKYYNFTDIHDAPIYDVSRLRKSRFLK